MRNCSVLTDYLSLHFHDGVLELQLIQVLRGDNRGKRGYEDNPK